MTTKIGNSQKLMQFDRLIKHRRADLINKTTAAEKAAAKTLKAMGYCVIMQYPIKTARKLFFADIALPHLRVIVEIDGGYHDTKRQKRLDANRSGCIRRMGWHVLRLSNHDAYDASKIHVKLTNYRKRIMHAQQ